MSLTCKTEDEDVLANSGKPFFPVSTSHSERVRTTTDHDPPVYSYGNCSLQRSHYNLRTLQTSCAQFLNCSHTRNQSRCRSMYTRHYPVSRSSRQVTTSSTRDRLALVRSVQSPRFLFLLSRNHVPVPPLVLDSDFDLFDCRGVWGERVCP